MPTTLKRSNERSGLQQLRSRSNPNCADARPLLGIVLVTNGEVERAAPYLNGIDLDSLASTDPTGGTLVALGSTEMEIGRWSDAAAAFRRALAINPSLAGVRESLSDALIQQGPAAEAIPWLEAAVRADANSARGMALGVLPTPRRGNSKAL